jgi:hypothetical protein
MNIGIYDEKEGVPFITPPLYWSRAASVPRNLARIQQHIADMYRKTATPEGEQPYLIDEAAIMVPDPFQRSALTAQLEAAGWEQFNEAEDLVYTNPFGTRYFVAYRFFRHPEWPFRLEVMMPSMGSDGRGGFSPLHTALWQPDGWPLRRLQVEEAYPIPHLSFKVPDLKSFSVAVQYLKDKAFLHAMTCQSTYGAFGYYISNETYRQVYLKPRVNTRDAV